MVKHKHYNEIIAWANGEEIEAYSVPANTWFQTSNPTWSKDVQYRVKPKQELIPFDFSDAEKLIGKSIKIKSFKEYYIITIVYPAHIFISGHIRTEYDELFKKFEFLDGSPCGKLKE